jgi:hypothetical protein
LEKKDWPSVFDGRSIVNETLRESERGVELAELQEKYDEAVITEDYWRLDVFANSACGLITKRQTAAEILDEVEDQISKEIQVVHRRLSELLK